MVSARKSSPGLYQPASRMDVALGEKKTRICPSLYVCVRALGATKMKRERCFLLLVVAVLPL